MLTARWRLGALVVLALTGAPRLWAHGSDTNSNVEALRRSVYKIRVISQAPDFSAPWRYGASQASSGTGFYIGKDRILTNAHVVANARFITVQRDGEPDAEPAYVTFIAHDADMALLTVANKAFFKGLRALRFGPLPKLRSPVSTIGYPMGGEELSITEGVVSRIDSRLYTHSGFNHHLLVQVDSAINPGNSGGPVVQNGAVVGIAFQAYTTAQSTGYIIPTPVIQRFLRDVADGHYDGHPEDGLTIQPNAVTNPATAAFHGLTKKDGGVLVVDVASWACTFGKILPGDILLKIDGHRVEVDGRVTYKGERVLYDTLFDLKQMGENVRFTVSRDGKVLEVPVVIAASKPHYFAGNLYAKHPKFLVYAGLVFTALSRNYLQTWGRNWWLDAPVTLRYLNAYANFEPATAGAEDIVVLASRLPHHVNTYVSDRRDAVVKSVDGQPVKSMANLRDLLHAAKGEFVTIDFLGHDVDPVVISRAQALAANDKINQAYGVEPTEWLEEATVDGALFSEGTVQ